MKRIARSMGLSASLLLFFATSTGAALNPMTTEAGLENAPVPILAERREPIRQESTPPPLARDAATGYPIVDGETWMTADNIPWSELVLIQQEGQTGYVAVLDRSYEEGYDADLRNPGIASLWSRRQLQVFGYGLEQTCWMTFICNTEHPVFRVSAASLKVGDRVFHLQPKGRVFVISEDIAWALKTAAPGQVWLRVAIAGGSNYSTRPIGPATIAAWNILYHNAEPATVAALPEAPIGPVSRLPEGLPADLPTVDESAWRRQSGVTWSEPIIVRDIFEGDYLAVLDRTYQEDMWVGQTAGMITNWSADQLAIHLYEQDGGSYRCWAVSRLELRVGGKVFELRGENNLFRINRELASVLASNLREPPRLTYQHPDGQYVTQEIGPGTVAAWRLIYGSASAEE